MVNNNANNAMERSVARNGDAAPDFFCVGAQKGGTGWLYEQLRTHPDFWMPPLKELHYFDRFRRSQNGTSRLRLFGGKTDRRIRSARRRARDKRDACFLEAMEKVCSHSDIDLPNYGRLFAPKGSLLSGDITPGYSTLPDEIIEQIARYFPELKVIFLARDPVERAWSQLSMLVRHGRIGPFDATNVTEVTRNLLRPEVILRSHPSRIVARWRRCVCPNLFRIYFFDDLKRNPTEVRRSIINFLGGDPEKSSGHLTAGHNSKAGKEKLQLTDSMRSHVARFFERELKACAAELGGAAVEWPERYGL